MLKVLGNKVLVKPDKVEETTATGIVLPGRQGQKKNIGTVVSVGPGRLLGNGKRIEPDIKAGDHVLFEQYVGAPITDNGEEYLIMTEQDIIAVL